VEPVELRGIRRAQVELLGVTGGTGVGPAFRWRVSAVPPVTPTGTTKDHQNAPQYHRLHLPRYESFTGLKTIFTSRLESIS
jgi:hypothetical protein